MSQGFISVYRKIFDNPIYFCEKFDRTHAWLDLILIANHKDGCFFNRGVQVEIKRGQIGYSLENISKRWRWSKGKVKRFLDALQTERQIEYQNTNVTTIITILNYDTYQLNGTQNGTQNAPQTDYQMERQIAPQTERKQYTKQYTKRVTNNNDNNDNNIKKKEKEKRKISIPEFQPEIKPLTETSINEVSFQKKSIHELVIEKHSQFYEQKVNVKYLFNGGADGRAAKEIIAHLQKAARDKGKPDDDDSIIKAWEFILSEHDKWDAFYRPQLKMIQIRNNLVNILANIKGIKNGSTKQNNNNALNQFLARAATADNAS